MNSSETENVLTKKIESPTNNQKGSIDHINNLGKILQSNLKINSSVLNKPFSNLKLKNDDKNFNNFDNNNNNNNNFNKSSTSDFFRNENNENNISKISFSGSINFDRSNEFNSNFVDSKLKRKPFDKLTFNLSSNDQNIIFDCSNGFNLTTNTDYFINNLNLNNRGNNNEQSKNDVEKDSLCNNNQTLKNKDNLKVENFGKIKNRIKDNLKSNKIEKYSNYSEKDENNKINLDLDKKDLLKENSIKNHDENNNSSLIKIKNFNENNVINSLDTLLKESRDTSNYLDDNKKLNYIKTNDEYFDLKINKKIKYENDGMKTDQEENESRNIRSSILNDNSKNNINNSDLSKNDFKKESKKNLLLQSQSTAKYIEETHLTDIVNGNNADYKIIFNDHNLINNVFDKSNQINLNNVSEINRTNLSIQEQSFLKSQNKFLNKETLEKAKLFNSQFDNQIPFWIKVFIDIKKNPSTIQSHSSYLKADDKRRYIKDLIEMVKKDAELYDASQKHQKIKLDGKLKLKSLLLTEVRLNDNLKKTGMVDLSNSNLNLTDNENSGMKSSLTNKNKSKKDIIQEETKNSFLFKKDEKNLSISESLNKSISEADITQDDIDKLIKADPINEKLAGVYNQYDKIEKIEQKKKIEKFSEFKKRLSKKDSIMDKYGLKNTDSNRFQSVVQSAMNRFAYPNLENIKDNINDDERIHKTIDNLKFPELFDPFIELDYSQFQLGYLDKEDLKRLFEIDKKLNKLNPDIYYNSINSDLYIMQIEFNEGKEERFNRNG